MFVYVLNCHGQPLMPCHPRKARLLLKEGRASVVRMVPFTIQLRYGSSGYTQEVSLGVDAGTQHIGVSATTEQKVVFEAEVKPRTDIQELLATRSQFRRARRSRKTRYRKPRCAPRHAVMYPPKIGEELEGRFLGHPSYLELKSEGDHSMRGTRGTSRGVADEWYLQDPHRRAKARLLEL